MHRFVVLSDLHIVPQGDLSHALDTAERLEQAVTHINTHHRDAAFCVLLGDLADRGDAASYTRMAQVMTRAEVPVFMTLGNHDDRPTFLRVMGEERANPDTGCVDFATTCGEAQVIVLDSSEPERTEGRLSPAQLIWLEGQLQAAKDSPVILLIHHAITALNVPTDFINLAAPEQFLDLAAAHGDVRMILSGHVHMSTAGQVRGLPFTTIAGCHYNIFPQMGGDIETVLRFDGPGQLANVLVTAEGVTVHHENFFDRHIQQPAPLYAWAR